MPSPWNDATDKQLLLTINFLSAPSLPKWDQVAKMMGDGYTAESVRQHFQKLRKECNAKFGDPAAANGASPKGTPTPRKTKTPASGKSTKKRKGEEVAEAEAEEGDDPETPCKKVKAESAEIDEF